MDAYPVNEIAEAVKAVSKADIDALVEEYYSTYNILLEGRDEKEFRQHVAVQAGIEIGFERFLEEKNYQAIVCSMGTKCHACQRGRRFQPLGWQTSADEKTVGVRYF